VAFNEDVAALCRKYGSKDVLTMHDYAVARLDGPRYGVQVSCHLDADDANLPCLLVEPMEKASVYDFMADLPAEAHEAFDGGVWAVEVPTDTKRTEALLMLDSILSKVLQ
jgi:hypothetical protein